MKSSNARSSLKIVSLQIKSQLISGVLLDYHVDCLSQTVDAVLVAVQLDGVAVERAVEISGAGQVGQEGES